MPEKKTVGRELVEKSGIDVETLLDLLVRNASAELYYVLLLHGPARKSDRPRRRLALAILHEEIEHEASWVTGRVGIIVVKGGQTRPMWASSLTPDRVKTR